MRDNVACYGKEHIITASVLLPVKMMHSDTGVSYIYIAPALFRHDNSRDTMRCMPPTMCECVREKKSESGVFALSHTASLMDFQAYFAVEALINNHPVWGLLIPASNRESTFSHHFHHLMLLESEFCNFIMSNSAQALIHKLLSRASCLIHTCSHAVCKEFCWLFIMHPHSWHE